MGVIYWDNGKENGNYYPSWVGSLSGRRSSTEERVARIWGTPSAMP